MGDADDAVQCGCVVEVLYPVIQLRLTRSGQSARRTVIGWQCRRRRDWSGLRYGYIRGGGRSTHGNRCAFTDALGVIHAPAAAPSFGHGLILFWKHREGT